MLEPKASTTQRVKENQEVGVNFLRSGYCICFLLLTVFTVGFAAYFGSVESGDFLGIVSAPTPEAAEAGAQILRDGGNAVDAAVAVAFALGVSEPAGSGIGGQAFLILQRPGEHALVINGTTRSPSNTPADAVAPDIAGRRASTVPSLVRVMDLAWKKFGSGNIEWMDLLQPAVRVAENGFRFGTFRRLALEKYAGELRADTVVRGLFLNADGSVAADSRVYRQPALAATLRRIAQEGAQDFYGGEIARLIAADMQANGGWMTFEDLAEFPDPVIQPALRSTYRGWEVSSLTPPAGGWVVLQALNLLEAARPEPLSGNSRLIWLAEALRIAFQNRRSEPVTNFDDYQRDVRKKIDKNHAQQLMRGLKESGGETTHFSVVDGSGTAVGVTASLNSYFGSRTAHAKLGFLYNDYMKEFEIGNPTHPFALRPRAVPYSSMSATILARDKRPQMVLGSPGSARIISSVVQVISNFVDEKMSVSEAVAAPRIHVIPSDILYQEVPLPEPVQRSLRKRGFKIQSTSSGLGQGRLDPYFGGVHALAYEKGEWSGAADPRRDGKVIRVQKP